MVERPATEGRRPRLTGLRLHQFFGLEEALQVLHLPQAHDQEDRSLGERPPENPAVGVFGRAPEPLLAVTLVVLLFRDLFHLILELSDPQLELRQFLLLGHFPVIDGVLSYLNVQMDTELRSREPSTGVGVQTDDVLSWGVRRERELALRGVHLGQDGLVVGVSDLHVHPYLG